jgi:NADH:ubiquinone oxidoreductase subunit E
MAIEKTVPTILPTAIVAQFFFSISVILFYSFIQRKLQGKYFVLRLCLLQTIGCHARVSKAGLGRQVQHRKIAIKQNDGFVCGKK